MSAGTLPTTPPMGVVLVGLALVVGLAHGGALRNGFLLDDFHLVVENPAVTSQQWALIWTSSQASSRDPIGASHFRPVTMTTYALDATWGNGYPWPYHATQLALHVLVVWVVYAAGAALWGMTTPAIAAALLVALHPAQTEAVHYLSARASLLATLGMVAAVWAYVRARDARGLRRRVFTACSVFAFALAVLSKESAWLGPLWFASYEVFLRRTSLKSVVPRLWPYLVIAGIAAALQHAVVPASAEPGASVPVTTGVGTGVVVIARHLTAWLMPTTVVAVSPQPWVTGNDPAAAGALILLTGLLLLIVLARRSLPMLSLGLACGLSVLLPVMILPFLTDTALFQPHRGYVASVGFAWATVAGLRALGAGAFRWARVRVGRRSLSVVLALGVAVFAGMGWFDIRQGGVWRNEVVFWSDAVSRYPEEAAYHHSLGAALFRRAEWSNALEAFSTARGLDPSFPRLEYNLGLVYTKLDRVDEARAAYDRAVERDPGDYKSLANLGLLYEREGDPARALDAYRRALRAGAASAPLRGRVDRLERETRPRIDNLSGLPAVRSGAP